MSSSRRIRRSAAAAKVRDGVRSAEQLLADGRASSYIDADGAMVLFGKRVRKMTANSGEPAQIIWEDGTTLDFPDLETMHAVLHEFGWEFHGFEGDGNARS